MLPMTLSRCQPPQMPSNDDEIPSPDSSLKLTSNKPPSVLLSVTTKLPGIRETPPNNPPPMPRQSAVSDVSYADIPVAIEALRVRLLALYAEKADLNLVLHYSQRLQFKRDDTITIGTHCLSFDYVHY